MSLFLVAYSIVLLSRMEMITEAKKKRHCSILLVSHVLLPVIYCSIMLLMFQFSRNFKCYFSSWLFHNSELFHSVPVEPYLNFAVCLSSGLCDSTSSCT